MLRTPRTAGTPASLVRSSCIAIASLALVAGSAAAADLGYPVRASLPSAAVWCWTGFYLGADLGYAWGKDTTTEYITATKAFTGFNPSYDLSSVVGGLFAGYNYQLGSAVLGVESDIEGTNLRGGFVDSSVGGAGNTVLNWQGSLRGRLGFAAGKVLVYGTGGLAFADVGHTYTNLITGIAETTTGLRVGWTAGAGVEVAVTQNLIARAEYRYTDYRPYRYDSVTSFPGFTGQQEPRYGAIRVGAAYKF